MSNVQFSHLYHQQTTLLQQPESKGFQMCCFVCRFFQFLDLCSKIIVIVGLRLYLACLPLQLLLISFFLEKILPFPSPHPTAQPRQSQRQVAWKLRNRTDKNIDNLKLNKKSILQIFSCKKSMILNKI